MWHAAIRLLATSGGHFCVPGCLLLTLSRATRICSVSALVAIAAVIFFFVGCGSQTKALKKTDACHTQHSVPPAAWYSCSSCCSRSSLCASLMFSVLFAVPFQLQFFALIRKCACKTRLVLPPCCLRLPPHKKVAKTKCLPHCLSTAPLN